MSAFRWGLRAAAVLALGLAPVACPVDIGLQEPDSGLSPKVEGRELTIIHGNDQTAPTGTTLPQPLRIRLVDAEGEGLHLFEVTWTITSGGGSVERVTTYTDVGGISETVWTLGHRIGRQTVMASVGGHTVEFEAEATGLL